MIPRATPRGLVDQLRSSRRYRDLPPLVSGRPLALGGLPGSAKAFLTAALWRDLVEAAGTARTILVVCVCDAIEVEEWTEDLALFAPGVEPLVLPELQRDERAQPLFESLERRRAVLAALPETAILLTDMSALLAPVAAGAPDGHLAAGLTLRKGQALEPAAVLQRALAAGLERVPQVLEPGQVSLRGDVVDVFVPGTPAPLRIEFFDELIESLRRFDPLAQTSTEPIESATLILAERGAATRAPVKLAHPLDLLPAAATCVIVVEPARFEEHLSRFTLRAGTTAEPVAAMQRAITGCRSLSLSSLPVTGGHDLGLTALHLRPSEGWDLKARILAAREHDDRPLVVLRSPPEVDRLLRLARETNRGGDPGLDAAVGHLTRGFRLPDLQRAILNHGEFFGTGVALRRPAGKKAREPLPTRAIDSFFELTLGDRVVHAVHGIAEFVGVERAARGLAGGSEDHLRLRFEAGVEVLVPSSKIDLVQKYVGAGEKQPKLDKLGSKSFARRKAQVAAALQDMAAHLLDVQVRRQAAPALACPPQDALYDEFESSFEFEDTPDQARATREILDDLGRERPMDRLLCGDVGFGKTELAMRAAFRVVAAGRQVAVLVPTTLLADQHGRTFRDRMASFPVRVAVVSRLQSQAEVKRAIEDAAHGRLDVLIGTHRLLADDVAFRDLGLLIVDEEQRFGVTHKEKIKALRVGVHVLTLTATPIPRTLHMALLGIKDISSLATPPPGRLEIETRLAPRQPAVVRAAIRDELDRGGQVFFLHNRVHDIEVVRGWLAELVPEARLVVGHGQMAEGALLRTMHAFVDGEADVLLSTTIIESGLDIPRANTILVDHADEFGLADLHQLRGRVGRDIHKATCLLLHDPTQPLSSEAKKRLQAMVRFAKLGSGFQIAMRDLEIRGAGNLLGAEQSGHIAAIGYDMYCRLLQAAVERAADPSRQRPEPVAMVAAEDVDVDLGVEAFLPPELGLDVGLRLALFREMDGAVDAASYAAVHARLRDRFGRLPQPVENLLSLYLVKHQLGSRGMTSARFEPPDQIVLGHPSGRGPQGRWLEAFADVRQVQPDRTCLVLPRARGKKTALGPLSVLETLRDALVT